MRNTAFGKSKEEVKTIVCTTPLRPVPTNFPPLASMSIVGSLRKIGYSDTTFYNIDLKRPSFEDAINHFVTNRPDIIGISAVVSTSYAYVKKLSLKLKEVLPDTIIVLGGNLGASAEIILRKTGVDFICTGEGELAIQSFVNKLREAKVKEDLADVNGWAYLDKNDQFVMTGYPDRVPREDVYDVDWNILIENDELDYFLIPMEAATASIGGNPDPRIFDEKYKGKNSIVLVASKGCVARCTFCHRYDKGIRYIPVPKVMERVDKFIKEHNVGYIAFNDENFGTDKRWLAQFVEEMAKRDVLWKVGGMRVNSIKEEWIVKMKEAGCVQILYGMESGSPDILKIMEKGTTLEQNRQTLEWMAKHDVPTILQIVIGMPGESPKTIRETAEFVGYSGTLDPKNDPNSVSINYAQALPGTPLYEFARRNGFIGQSIEDEEEYLLAISDRNAADGETTLNFTGYPRLEYDVWHKYIQMYARIQYIKKWGIESYKKCLLQQPRFRPMLKKYSKTTGFDNGDTGYFASPARDNEIIDDDILQKKKEKEFKNSYVDTGDTASNIKQETIELTSYPSFWHLLKQRKFGLVTVFYPRLTWSLRYLNILMILVLNFKKYNKKLVLSMIAEFFNWKLNSIVDSGKRFKHPYLSLRKILKNDNEGEIPTDSEGMKVLRLGR